MLPRLCDELVIPSGVVEEVAVCSRGNAGRVWLAADGAQFIKPSPPLAPELKDVDLGRGEAEVISWALRHPGFKTVLDDRQGRIWAKRLAVPLLGSLGVVVSMKLRGLIPLAAPALHKIRAAGGYVSEAAVQAALQQAGES